MLSALAEKDMPAGSSVRSSSDLPWDLGAERGHPTQPTATDPEAAASLSMLIRILGRLRAGGKLLYPSEFAAYEAATNAKRYAIRLLSARVCKIVA